MSTIFLVGPMGAGKTTIGKLLAADLCYRFIDSDREIESRAGADISWIFDVEGEEGFRKRETQVIADLSQSSETVVATGGGAILTAEVREILKANASTVYIYAPLKVLLDRTGQDKTRPLLRVSDPKSALEKILKERESLYEEVATVSVCSDHANSKQIVSDIKEKL